VLRYFEFEVFTADIINSENVVVLYTLYHLAVDCISYHVATWNLGYIYITINNQHQMFSAIPCHTHTKFIIYDSER
jgi:hypothetical protein